MSFIFPSIQELNQKARADILLINEADLEDVSTEVWDLWQREYFILFLRGQGRYFLSDGRWEVEREFEIVHELDELLRMAKDKFSEIPLSLLQTWTRSPVDLFTFHGSSYYRKLQGDIFFSDDFFIEFSQRSRSRLFCEPS